MAAKIEGGRAASRRGELDVRMTDKRTLSFSCPIGALESISDHDPDLIPLVAKLASKQGTLADVRAVLSATNTDPGAEALIEKYGLVVCSYLAGLALGAGVGLDEEDSETVGKPMAHPE